MNITWKSVIETATVKVSILRASGFEPSAEFFNELAQSLEKHRGVINRPGLDDLIERFRRVKLEPDIIKWKDLTVAAGLLDQREQKLADKVRVVNFLSIAQCFPAALEHHHKRVLREGRLTLVNLLGGIMRGQRIVRPSDVEYLRALLPELPEEIPQEKRDQLLGTAQDLAEHPHDYHQRR